jgi:two-component system, chemotaxis family, sensor kinase CheA
MLGLFLCGLVVAAVPEIQRLTRSPEVAGNVLVAAIVGICSFTNYYIGGAGAPSLYWLIPGVVVALILVKRAHAFSWLGLAVAVVWAYYLCPPDALPRSFLTPLGSRTLQTFSASGLAILLFSIIWSFERAKNRMRAELGQVNHDLSCAKVRAEAAHQKTRLILDNVGQGFLILDRAGRVGDVRSASVDGFLAVSDGASFADTLRQDSPEAATLFDLNWNQILDAFLPLEMAIDQLPKRVVLRGRHVGVDYQPLLEADALAYMIVILTDVTNGVERERAEQAERESLSVLRQVMSDGPRFTEFLAEGAALVDSLVEGSVPFTVERRNLHTLKGISGFHGLGCVVERCHDLETKQADTGEPLDPSDRAALGQLWQRATGFFASLVGAHVAETIELSRTEHAAFVERVKRGLPHSALCAEASSWTLEPLEKRLHAVGEQAKVLAQRLGKGEIQIVIDSGAVRQSREAWRAFWSAFSHAVRNAIDHGLEPTDERVALGKSRAGSIELRSYVSRDRYVIEIADDGRGIDWGAVATKARDLGLTCVGRSDLEERLFDDGFSTAPRTTAVSGRGIGMGVLRAATHARGGHIQVESTSGSGTRIRFVFPANDVMAPNRANTDQDQPLAEGHARPP